MTVADVCCDRAWCSVNYQCGVAQKSGCAAEQCLVARVADLK